MCEGSLLVLQSHTSLNRRARNAHLPLRSAVESLEDRTFLSAVADFSDGEGGFPGSGVDGWAAGWTWKQTGATGFAPSIGSAQPLSTGGGKYLRVNSTTSASNGKAGVSRGYASTGDIDSRQPHVITFDWRLDSTLTGFTDDDDRVTIFGGGQADDGTGSGTRGRSPHTALRRAASPASWSPGRGVFRTATSPAGRTSSSRTRACCSCPAPSTTSK